jgi:hypothetical protein
MRKRPVAADTQARTGRIVDCIGISRTLHEKRSALAYLTLAGWPKAPPLC